SRRSVTRLANTLRRESDILHSQAGARAHTHTHTLTLTHTHTHSHTHTHRHTHTHTHTHTHSHSFSNSNQCIFNRTSYRSEEHTSELQSHLNLVCRLLLEKK